MTTQDTTHQVWLPVIGRALSYLCMQNADMEGKTKVEKARFLEALGLERKEVATYASITELMSQAKKRNKKGAKKSAARKTKGR